MINDILVNISEIKYLSQNKIVTDSEFSKMFGLENISFTIMCKSGLST